MRDLEAEGLQIASKQFFSELSNLLANSPFYMTAVAGFDRPARRRLARQLGKQLTTIPTFRTQDRPVMGEAPDGSDLYVPNRKDRRAAGYRDPVDFG